MNPNKIIEQINSSDKLLFKLFKEPLNQELLEKLNKISVETHLIAITPRSGSSYFIDLLRKTNKMGEPGEYLNSNLVPDIINNLQVNNFYDFWVSLIKRKSCETGFGVKASFFQFEPLIETGLDELLFKNRKIILLQRKNIIKQAISLYLATQSNIFHTNIEHSKDKWAVLETIEYSNKDIQNWVKHIYNQELGWKKYLTNKSYLSLWYEDILNSPQDCVINTLSFLNLKPNEEDVNIKSIFKKLRNAKNQEFYEIFLSKKSNIDYLHKLTILDNRF